MTYDQSSYLASEKEIVLIDNKRKPVKANFTDRNPIQVIKNEARIKRESPHKDGSRQNV